jgi:hypothetical protein
MENSSESLLSEHDEYAVGLLMYVAEKLREFRLENEMRDAHEQFVFFSADLRGTIQSADELEEAVRADTQFGPDSTARGALRKLKSRARSCQEFIRDASLVGPIVKQLLASVERQLENVSMEAENTKSPDEVVRIIRNGITETSRAWSDKLAEFGCRLLFYGRLAGRLGRWLQSNLTTIGPNHWPSVDDAARLEIRAGSPSVKSDQSADRPADIELDRAPDSHWEESFAILAEMFGETSMGPVWQIARDKSRSAGEKISLILVLEPRLVGWKSPQWAKLLGISDSAVRQTPWWIDRKGERPE